MIRNRIATVDSIVRDETVNHIITECRKPA